MPKHGERLSEHKEKVYIITIPAFPFVQAQPFIDANIYGKILTGKNEFW